MTDDAYQRSSLLPDDWEERAGATETDDDRTTDGRRCLGIGVNDQLLIAADKGEQFDARPTADDKMWSIALSSWRHADPAVVRYHNSTGAVPHSEKGGTWMFTA